jgi:hypothetical protein
MRSFLERKTRARQRGWIGLVMVLVALVVVAFLAKDALKQYGLVPGATASRTGTKAASPGERARSPGAMDIDASDLESAPVAPASALERARGVQDMVNKQAEERARELEGKAK